MTLVIGLIIAIILGPLLMLKPSRGTQRIAALRLQALQMGLIVQSHRHPAISADAQWMFYLQPWPSFTKVAQMSTWALVKKNYSHEIHLKGQWDFQGTAPQQTIAAILKNHLEQLPEQVAGIEATSAGIGIYWNERGGEKMLKLLSAWLDDLVSTIALQPHNRPPGNFNHLG